MDDDALSPVAPDGGVLSLTVNAQLRRTGMETKLLLEEGDSGGQKRKPNRSLVRLLVQARSFHDAVKENEDKTIREIASEIKVNASYVTRIMRLTYLAPDIVQSILDGSQPPTLTANRLKNASKLPLSWQEQRQVLGFV